MKAHEARAGKKIHRDRQINDVVHDPYQARSKPAEPAVCPQCGVIYHKGRWQRAVPFEQAKAYLCPACHRVNDRNPAGFVSLSGPYLGANSDEILRLVRNEETREAQDHPLQRIMDIENKVGVVTITTTDVHLARRIGDAVRAAFSGNLVTKYSRDEHRVRVNWSR